MGSQVEMRGGGTWTEIQDDRVYEQFSFIFSPETHKASVSLNARLSCELIQVLSNHRTNAAPSPVPQASLSV